MPQEYRWMAEDQVVLWESSYRGNLCPVCEGQEKIASQACLAGGVPTQHAQMHVEEHLQNE